MICTLCAGLILTGCKDKDNRSMTIIEKTAFAGSDIQDIIIDGPFTVKISDDASTGVRFRVNEYLECNISYLLNGTTLRIKLNDGAVV